MTIGLTHYLMVAAILFTIGVLGIFVNRRNVIVILMSIELILLAVNINLGGVLGLPPRRLVARLCPGRPHRRRRRGRRGLRHPRHLLLSSCVPIAVDDASVMRGLTMTLPGARGGRLAGAILSSPENKSGGTLALRGLRIELPFPAHSDLSLPVLPLFAPLLGPPRSPARGGRRIGDVPPPRPSPTGLLFFAWCLAPAGLHPGDLGRLGRRDFTVELVPFIDVGASSAPTGRSASICSRR